MADRLWWWSQKNTYFWPKKYPFDPRNIYFWPKNAYIFHHCCFRSLIPEDSEGRPRTQKSQSERRKVSVIFILIRVKGERHPWSSFWLIRGMFAGTKKNMWEHNIGSDMCQTGAPLKIYFIHLPFTSRCPSLLNVIPSFTFSYLLIGL